MTILFFARRFHPLIGGVEKHVLEISKILLKKGHNVIVFTELSENSKEHELLEIKELNKNIEVYRVATGKDNLLKKFRIWKQLWNMRNIIRAADIIHCHDIFFWYLPFRFLFFSKKVFITFHGYESYPIKKKAILVRKISEILSHGNICIGDFIKKWYGTHADYVSYGAVDLNTWNKQVKIKNKKSAVFIGRMDEQTGILTYVQSIKLIKKYIENFTFLVVGDGEYKKSLPKNVTSTGFQKNPEKYLVQSRFAFISRYLGILEAFAAKRLVFAVYDNPVKEDYLRMAPFAKFMVIANTPKQLCEQVLYFLNNPDEESERITKAYEWVEKQTWEKMVQTYVKLWQK